MINFYNNFKGLLVKTSENPEKFSLLITVGAAKKQGRKPHIADMAG